MLIENPSFDHARGRCVVELESGGYDVEKAKLKLKPGKLSTKIQNFQNDKRKEEGEEVT